MKLSDTCQSNLTTRLGGLDKRTVAPRKSDSGLRRDDGFGAGMTVEGAGMKVEGAGMTVLGLGTLPPVAGVCCGLTGYVMMRGGRGPLGELRAVVGRQSH